MQLITGAPARGNNFFRRTNIIQKAWDLIESRHHILIAAPRRVGKTSVMCFLQDNPKDNYLFLLLNTESINNENEFYRRIVNKLMKTDLIASSRKTLTFIQQHIPSIKKIGPDGIEFGVKEERNYFELLTGILTSIPQDAKRIVIMLDEFPQTLENIIEDEGAQSGKLFLHSNRELRQNTDISDKVTFIYTGSIGLENIVGRMNATKSINDLSRLVIPPLNHPEAISLIHELLGSLPFDLQGELIDYIFEKIEWLIPFYIQLVIEGLKNLHRDETLEQITTAQIDRVFAGMLDQKNHFEHWHTRLRTTLKGHEYNFTKQVLNIMSENGTLHRNEIVDLSVKHQVEEAYKELIGALIYDGYINNNEDQAVYRYNSPILKMWWRKNVAN